MFWYYFESNKKRPVIEEEQFIPCGYIDPSINNQFLFKVKYFNKRISLEVFHAITDGAGAIEFLKELTYHYIKLANKDDFAQEIAQSSDAEKIANIEDSYLKNYEKKRIIPYSSEKAYHFKGDKLPIYMVSVIHGYISRHHLSEVCKKYNVSITQYLTSVLIWSIYKECGDTKNKPVQVTIPVNLRTFFDSTTVMNFFSFIFIKLLTDKNDYTFDAILEITKRQFKEQLIKENFSSKIAYNVSQQKNIFIRFMPLPIKNILIKLIYINSTKASTTTLSNLGKIEIAEEYKNYIEDFGVLLSATNPEPFKCAVCSFNEKFVITFTSRLKSAGLQCAFFRKLASDGLEIMVESNGVYNEKL